MAKVDSKDVPDQQARLGQFFTPPGTVEFCLSKTAVATPLVVEPSYGAGAFLAGVRAKCPGAEVLGVEIDPSVAATYSGPERVVTANFYDFDLLTGQDITFIGNPPYRTPACSLGRGPDSRADYVHDLCARYGVRGVREEAVFFILKSVDLILKNRVRGHLYYVLPKTIFRNNSRAFKTFTDFLTTHCRLVSLDDLGRDFPGVTTDLCWVHLAVDGTRSDEFLWNGSPARVDAFYGVDAALIPFQRIFKKTYLGSVPCESVLLSCRDEPLDHFRRRLSALMEATRDEAPALLRYNGVPHLKALQRGDRAKLAVVLGYLDEIRALVEDDFGDREWYRPIRHRHEDRWYFRHHALKRASFVYQLNPNPCPSFYFPGNPVKGCMDYWGFCEYDVNRNCSPSANRTVPVDGVGDNLTDEFKGYWRDHTNRPYADIFSYLDHVLKSGWYKAMKKEYQRWYFGVPAEWMEDWK